MTPVLLDTSVLIRLKMGGPLNPEAVRQVEKARLAGAAYLSTATAWEIGTLHRKNRISFLPDPLEWWRMASADFQIIPIEVRPALRAGQSDWGHLDPADRFLVFTAMEMAAQLATEDGLILAYADAAPLEVLPC